MKLQSLNCPACGASSFEHLNSYATRDIYQRYGLTDQEAVFALENLHSVDHYHLIKCVSCKLEIAQPLCAPSAGWYGVLYENLKLYPTKRWEYDFVLKNTMAGHAICDVGCGSGQFLEHAVKAGFKSIGVDFSEDAVASGRSKGLDIHLFGINDLQNEKIERSDTVVSFQVLEHLESPADLFKSAQALGKIDSNFWLSIPSDRRPSRMYSETDYLDLPPHHMTHWTKASLEFLAAKNGWTMIGLYYEPISLKQVIWNATVRSSLYKTMHVGIGKHKWLDRFVRASFFVPIGLMMYFSKQEISGFSMLAKFQRNINV